MRQVHRAGEKIFVDFAGLPSVTELAKRRGPPGELFVGGLGACSYTYAEASRPRS